MKTAITVMINSHDSAPIRIEPTILSPKSSELCFVLTNVSVMARTKPINHVITIVSLIFVIFIRRRRSGIRTRS